MFYDIGIATENKKLIKILKETRQMDGKISIDPVYSDTQLNRFFKSKGMELEILILDLSFRKINIDKLIFYIKQYKKDLPVVLLMLEHRGTNAQLVEQKEICRNLNIYGYFKKPRNKKEAILFMRDLNGFILEMKDSDKKFEKVNYMEKEKVFSCTFRNGRTYFLNRNDIIKNQKSKITDIAISENAYHFSIVLSNGKKYEIPWDFVLSLCEKKYEFYRDSKKEVISGEEIGNRIKKIRKTKKITQLKLARKSGILRANISRLEKGKHSPNLETLEKIADALEIPVSNLVAKRKR